MDKKRIVYVEDGEFRYAFGAALKNGFKQDGVEVDPRTDFQQLKQELKEGDLADVYILDNEIAGEEEGKEGGQMAQAIFDRAKELGRDVLIITMLCSNPDGVREQYGQELDIREIPVLHKNIHASLCAFFIGRCLTRGKIGFQDWLKEEGVVLPEYDEATKGIDGKIYTQVESSKPGSFFQPLREFASMHRKEILKWASPQEEMALDSMLPTISGREVK